MKRFIIRPENRETVSNSIREYLEMLNIDKPQEIIVREYKKNRSANQNSLLWKWYGCISQELGYNKDEIHDLMRYKFLGMRAKEVAGQRIEYLPSTTKLKVGEMAEYMEAISRFAAELGIRLPAEE